MDNFLIEETRNEFHVDVNRKKIRKAELEILEQLLIVCEKYELKVYASGGTMLGCVRHSGFIPWDDDIDVAMTRHDFEKLCYIASDEFKYPYFLQNALSDRSYFVGYARLRKSDTTGIIKDLSKHKYNNGIFVDILVLDKIAQNPKKLSRQIKKIKIYSFILNNYYFINSVRLNNKFLKAFINLINKTFSYDHLYKKYKKIVTKYNSKCGDVLGFLCAPEFINELYSLKGIEESKKMPFEYLKIEVPKNYENILTNTYGEYMKFPPVEERGKWHDSIIIFDPDKPFLKYYQEHRDIYNEVLAEYFNKE